MLKIIVSIMGRRGILGVVMILGAIIAFKDAEQDANDAVLGKVTQDQYGHIHATSGSGGWNAIDNLMTISQMEKENRRNAIIGGLFGLGLIVWGIRVHNQTDEDSGNKVEEDKTDSAKQAK